MMDRRGTVTPLASMIPAEEALKASKRVQETIDERQRQLEQLKGFIDDNISLINLVGKLPDETHHHIMVPFGKAAFFPGRVVHTNELMVLLGEGYYAERSAKQTIEILQRREKSLETQVQSVEAIMRDLKAEASFFDATAIESSEGLVEIREDYLEERSQQVAGAAGEMNDIDISNEDEEYQRIFLRMAELEKEEEAANDVGTSEPMKGNLESSSSEFSINEDLTTSLIENTAKSKAVDFHPTDKAMQPPAEKKQLPRTTAAFTGSIVEHDHNFSHPPEMQPGPRSSTKPVSRFKMQRK